MAQNEPRPALASDVTAITSLVRGAYAKYVIRMGKEPKPMTVDYAKAVREHQIWVVEDAGEMAGVLELVPQPDHLLIENVAVNSALQGHGLGRRLMKFAENEALRQGFSETRLYTHESMVENIRLYARIGYRETERHQQDGFARVFMSKKLSD
ncbi:MAG: GNAT family N-acetyltransferase [SAR324 cluster bacterium]|nr:GNAT family N-acetyltransferase [SAR324 cluster bacterium]